ncbi:MAG: NAD(P)H-dependent glycerol-3-phosphate dehydrogenase [Erysipelotrichaceae bacterium]
MENKVFVLGSGSWGTALAAVLADNNIDVTLYGRNKAEVDDINQNHQNAKFFKTVLPANLKATNDLSSAKNYPIILTSVPSKAFEEVLFQLNDILTEKTVFINAAKGFHPVSYQRLSEVYTQTLNQNLQGDYFALIGPSFADEVVEKKITTINLVGENQELSTQLQVLFSNDYFRVYRNDDLIGAEYASGLKNVIALASGTVTGLGLQDNAKASLITRGLSEISRYGLAHGGKLSTFMGLCGMGDLILTCSSFTSRNFQAGYLIGKNDSSEIFWKENKSTVEGVNACNIIYHKAKKENIEMPITSAVYQVLFENKKPSEVVKELMNRDLKYEIY